MHSSVVGEPKSAQAGFGDGLQRRRPHEGGVDARDIDAFLADLQRLGVELNSFMLWRDGGVIAEGWWWPYRPALSHMMHSATKSFLSAGVGIALEEGRFTLEDKVQDVFSDKLPATVSPMLSRMTVEDLLTQTSGHAEGASGAVWRSIKTSWITEFFKIPVLYPPGEHFRYTSATSFMLSALISRTTGQSAHDYIKPRLLDPLGIEDLTWDIGPEDINPGGNGISCRTSDLLKLGILHLQGGRWGDRQVLPADWVKQVTSPKRGNPHGYHWWMGPQGAFYAYGVFGQFAVVFPEHDAVLTITASAPYGEETLRSVIWSHFPRLFGQAHGSRDEAAESALTQRCADLRALPPFSVGVAGAGASVAGVTFEAEANEDGIDALRLDFEDDACLFELRDARGVHRLRAGLKDWLEGETTMSGAMLHHGYDPGSLKVVAAGRWIDERRFEMIWQFVETAFRDTVVIEFTGDSASFDRQVNVNSRLPIRPTVRLKRAGVAP